MGFIQIFEAPEAEVARLAQAPEGSKYHQLSQLPVNIAGLLADLMIELPRETFSEHTVIVVPVERYKDIDTGEERTMPYRRYEGSWKCVVVASNHPSYPVGGHRLSISEAELVRGTQRTFELAEVTA